ncbi:hypothetical protein V6C27_02350 [Peptococcaceae bacterium 1198_IL3148]
MMPEYCLKRGDPISVKLADHRGQWVMLFFYTAEGNAPRATFLLIPKGSFSIIPFIPVRWGAMFMNCP